MMKINDYCITGNAPVKLCKMPCDGKDEKLDKAEIVERTAKNLAEIATLQEKLYAEGKESVLVVLQAMDAAGKDSTIKHVMSSVNPQGIDVVSFKQPSTEELAHDFLWRAVKALPTRGKMGIFNRSYYEDVLVVRVHHLEKTYKMADRVIDDADFFKKRYRQITHFEEYLYENSMRVVKIFLHVSPQEQKKRFLERIDDAAKNWKFSSSDLKEREHWAEYMEAYEDAINATATEHSPWYVLPADQKWFTRFLVSEAILKALQDCNPQYPELPQQDKDNLNACKAQLLAEPEKKKDKSKQPAHDSHE